MTREDLARALADIEHALTQRLEVWRIVTAPDGHVVRRIHRRSFGSRTRIHKGDSTHDARTTDSRRDRG